jgi:TolB protein
MPMPAVHLLTLAFATFAEAAPLTASTDAYPMLSPDGETLLFQSNRSGRWALYVADPKGGNLRVLLDSGDDPVVPVWSPDGRRIAFAAKVGEWPEIFVMDRDGSNRRRLTDHPGDDSHPVWSADGKRVFFNSSRGTPDASLPWPQQWHDIYSIAIDGEDLRRHTHCEAVCTFPAPSPDGRRVAYRRIFSGPGLDWALRSRDINSEVVIADIDGRNERNLTRHAAYDGWPTWSPDGRFLVISSNRTGKPNVGQLFAIAPDGDAAPIALTDGEYGYVQARFAGMGVLYASRVREASDWSWSYGHVVRIEVSLPGADALAE